MKIKKLKIGIVLMILAVAAGLYVGKRVAYCHCCHAKAVTRNYEPNISPRKMHPTLTWSPVNLAVAYELEMLTDATNLSAGQRANNVLFTTTMIYTNAYNINLEPYKDYKQLYWRVRALDIDKKPISNFTNPVSINITGKLDGHNYPEPTAQLGKGQGGTLLYPVYAWIPMEGAAKYEVEVLSNKPENPEGTAPSRYRIWAKETTLSDLYDEKPRVGANRFYWRVRAFDEKGSPLGTYSPALSFTTNPEEKWDIGVFGDSISHGGGDMSYSPADLSYSWIHYLDRPAINLSCSGDTSATMVARFDKDVLPFGPEYLFIMGGTNSLRAGVSASDVIADLTELRDKCLVHKIEPIFLTLLPINPTNIEKCFNEPTAPGWQQEMRKVNAFIRSQHHIDVAAAMPFGQQELPSRMGIDGLHANADAKKIMAATINADWANILVSTKQPRQNFLAKLF